jgi:polysaccharide export outer membrane protein
MRLDRRRIPLRPWLALATLAVVGCHGGGHHLVPDAPAATLLPPTGVPTELNMVSLPPYVIGPPDLLLINVVTPPLKALDPPVPLQPQPISDQHLVRPDGTVNLGLYGAVSVAGLTVEQAREAVRRQVFEQMQALAKQLAGGQFAGSVTPVANPNDLLVVVDVAGYNSKKYHVVLDGGGYGEQIAEFPYQGYETVLNALANVGGLHAIGSKADVWVARRTPHRSQPEQILCVDYVAVTQHGIADTNYQLFPGDRVYVRAEKVFRFDNTLQKFFTPIERVLGITLLGGSAYNTVTNRRQNSGSGLFGN